MSSGKWSMQNTVNWWIPCWGNAYMTSKNLEEERAGRRWARRVWSKSACFSTLLEPWNTASLGLEVTQEGSTPTSYSEQASCETRPGCSGLCLVRSQKRTTGMEPAQPPWPNCPNAWLLSPWNFLPLHLQPCNLSVTLWFLLALGHRLCVNLPV